MYVMDNKCKKENTMQDVIRKRNVVIQEKSKNKSVNKYKSILLLC